MSVAQAQLRVGGLSDPSKMPTVSWSVSPRHCRAGSRLRKLDGSVCSDCYGCKGRYRMPNTIRAMARRLRSWRRAQRGGAAALEAWARAFATAIGRRAWFRWFDNGDVQPGMLPTIVRIAELRPGVRFWLPTKELGDVRRLRRPIPPNLTVRASAAMIDGPPPKGFACTSGVHTDPACIPAGGMECPAYQNDGACGDCRACWDPRVSHVSYPLH